MGKQKVSKLGLTLLRDNRDSLLFTRSGNRTSIDTEFAGLGGDVDYFKLDFVQPNSFQLQIYGIKVCQLSDA